MKKILHLTVMLALLAALGAHAQAPKMAELKAQSPESLWTFLRAMPASFEAQLFYAIVCFGALGVMVNYAVKWMKKEIAGSLFAYLFVDNFRGTLLSWTTTAGAGIAGITSGMFETPDGTFIGWFRALVLCFGNGFFWDAVMNRGKQAA
jgi:hypothetical protein